MMHLLTAQQMKRCDDFTIKEMGMDSMVLMERAALAVANTVKEHLTPEEKVLIVCGSGNNGADGFAAARILFLWHYNVEIFMVGNPEHCSLENQKQQELCKRYLVPMVNNPVYGEYTIIVDAIFGIGLSREIHGEYQKIIDDMHQSKAMIISVDIPSGIDASSGKILGCAVQATETVTFAYPKVGHLLYPGAAYTGKLICEDVGIYNQQIPTEDMLLSLTDEELDWLPKRQPGGHKGTYGKALIIAGSEGMCGAAYLCACGCFATGAGMVRILTVEENRSILQQMLPEAMVSVIDPRKHKKNEKLLEDAYDWCDVAAIGPGIGTEKWSVNLVNVLLNQQHKKPVVIDADALNIISTMAHMESCLSMNCIVTPHLGEMSRLTGLSVKELVSDTIAQAKLFAQNYHCTCVLKNARTVIANEQGQAYLNINGNHGMSTAGAGDVLTGILVGLLALGMETGKAAPLGVYLHGMAGDQACRTIGPSSMKAGDIVVAMEEIMKEITREEAF